MAIPKRITEPREVVSLYDPAFVVGFSEEQKDAYRNSLEIEELGDMKDLTDRPTVFVVKPLNPKFEYMIYGSRTDVWGCFKNHVQEVRDFPVNIEYESGVMLDKHREDFPARVVHDIVNMIVAIANKTSDDFFFTPSAESLLYDQKVQQRRIVTQSRILANSVAAQIKDSD